MPDSPCAPVRSWPAGDRRCSLSAAGWTINRTMPVARLAAETYRRRLFQAPSCFMPFPRQRLIDAAPPGGIARTCSALSGFRPDMSCASRSPMLLRLPSPVRWRWYRRDAEGDPETKRRPVICGNVWPADDTPRQGRLREDQFTGSSAARSRNASSLLRGPHRRPGAGRAGPHLRGGLLCHRITLPVVVESGWSSAAPQSPLGVAAKERRVAAASSPLHHADAAPSAGQAFQGQQILV